MAKLIIRKLGAEFMQLELTSGQEYIVGRSSECSIQLEESKGISRQHLRIHDQNGTWAVELMSRYGTLIHEGQNADFIELGDQSSFSVPPYDFLFVEKTVEAQAQFPEATEARHRMREEKSLVAQQPTELRPVHSSNVQSTMVLNQVGEHTSAGISQLVPYLKISYPDHGKDEVVKLEGNLWVAGRDNACEIPIDDHHISRRHFELTHTSEGFYITDLDSANGTQVNGDKIPGNEPHLIQSGDRISIMDVNIDFEVRDSQFEQRLQVATRNLPVLAPMNPIAPYQDPYQGLMPYMQQDGPAVVKVENGKKIAGILVSDLKSLEFYKKHKIRVVIALLVPVFIFGLLPDSKKVEKKDSASLNGSSISYDKLTPEQKTAIKDSFQLSTNLYVKGKYELCLSELDKLHKMIPQYENSKELQTFCKQGSELTQRIKEKEMQDQKKAEADRRIKMVYDDCTLKLQGQITSQEMEVCLAPAIELDPGHYLVKDLMQKVMDLELAAREKVQAQQQRVARVNSGKSQFRQAKALAQKGKLSAALKAYQRFLNGGYSDLSNEQEVARRELASVKKQLETKVQTLLATCKTLRSEGKFKDAYLTCGRAKEEDPENTEAGAQMRQAESELKTEMKSVYEDSVLEESLGNIDAAKQKWTKIMADDLKDGDYYTKAKSKLKRYGIGM